MKRKFESGSSKRKNKLKREAFVKSIAGSLDKFTTKPVGSTNLDDSAHPSTSQNVNTAVITENEEKLSETKILGNFEISEASREKSSQETSSNDDLGENSVVPALVSADPGTWPTLTHAIRASLVQIGPKQITDYDFPVDSCNRHFTTVHYSRKLKNSEIVVRSWLIYSKLNNCVYCFPCKLFNKCSKTSALAQNGFSDWKNASRAFSSHELSTEHIGCATQWKEMEAHLKSLSTIDKQNEQLINSEKMHWQNVLTRLIAIIQYLAERNMAFRGSVDRLFEPNNGNFLSQVELMAKFDPVLAEHLRRVKNKETLAHFLGKRIQDELLLLISDKILQQILGYQKVAKYYSVILDCTPDISRKEQMSVVIRFVKISTESVEICEHFLGFLNVVETTGESLTGCILSFLQKNSIPIADCRGQGYDNGSNMKGKNQGVQQRILDMNPRAFYVPCGCHSLNLVVSDGAKSSVTAISFFGHLQKVYAFFAASAARWKILKATCNLTLKPLSDTRWECKIDATKVLMVKAKEIRCALINIRDLTNDGIIRNDAHSLADEIGSFRFLLCLVIWHTILMQINKVSKIMQNADMQADVAVALIDATKEFLVNYRKSGFVSAVAEATLMANELDVAPELPQQRLRKKKRQFDYEGFDNPIEDVIKQFEIEFFNHVIDTAINSLDERFVLLQNLCDKFGFLFNIRKLHSENFEVIKKHCSDLQINLSDGYDTDVDGSDLASELVTLSQLLFSDSKSDLNMLDTLKFIYKKGLAEIFPNCNIALQILRTLPVTVASAERSFSKLKLIKTYLRSTLSQDKLNGLAIVAVEHKEGKLINYSEIIEKFAAVKARRKPV